MKLTQGTDFKLNVLLVALALGVGSFTLFAYRIGNPTLVYFDETHYVPAARALIARSGPVNIEHPIFAKMMIAAGIELFGDNSIGWRLPSAFFASVSVVALFWIARMMFGADRPAIFAALLAVFLTPLAVLGYFMRQTWATLSQRPVERRQGPERSDGLVIDA